MKTRPIRIFLLTSIAAALIGRPADVRTQGQTGTGGSHQHGAAGHTLQKNPLSEGARQVLSVLMVQDFQGRMKPFDTLSRESMMKITKRTSYEGWEPVDLYLSWMSHPQAWFDRPLIAVRYEGLKTLLGVPPSTKLITASSLLDERGRYRLVGEVERAHRTPDKARTKTQRKLLSLDERVNVFNMAIRGLTFRAFPIPGDENDRWIGPGEFDGEGGEALGAETLRQYRAAFEELFRGLQNHDNAAALRGAQAIYVIQQQHGSHVMPSAASLKAEMQLNRLQPFTWVTIPYLFAFAILMLAYAWRLARHQGKPYRFRHPVYVFGLLLFAGSVLYTIYGYVLRWIAGGHAPLSNGYESLLFISLMIGVVGLYYEMRSRHASIGALAALLTAVMLGVAMLPTFDPNISPLVPVLASFWLIVHVSIITASYGFLGLAAVIAMMMLILYLFKASGRRALFGAVLDLHQLHWNVLVAGLAFLSIGTFLGGVWANESWGRYWGWDPKETWSLVTILVYAFVIHLRFVPKLFSPLNIAAGSFLSIASVGMTYFGVNYFLSGLHSYAQGDAPGVPGWVYVMAAVMVLLVIAAYAADATWDWEGKRTRAARRGSEALSPR